MAGALVLHDRIRRDGGPHGGDPPGLGSPGEDGRLRLDGRIDLDKRAAANLDIDGDVPLGWLSTFFPEAEAQGRVKMSVKALGPRESVDLRGTMALDAEAGHWGGFSWTALSARAEAKGTSIAVDKAEVRAFGGRSHSREPCPCRDGGGGRK